MISIITPSYNCSSYIASTIQSVISQTFTDWEMIIIDDCSTDDSVQLIQSFVELDPRIKLIQLTQNSGAAVARNKGIELASGRFIAFLDSDDLWFPEKLDKQVRYMSENKLPFTFTAYAKQDQAGVELGHVGVPNKVSYSDLLKVCSIGCLTAMYDTQFFGKVYMPLIRKRQDLGLWLRLLKKTDYAYGLDEVLASYTIRNDSISANKSKAALYTWTLYREVEKLSIITAVYYFSHYAVNGVLRTKFPKLARALGVLK